MSIDVDMSGPVFDGELAKRMSSEADRIERELADEAAKRIKRVLGRSLQNPTGRYMSSITVDNTIEGGIVTDGGVIYGPWLEGVSSRNQRSRFKGYAAFRKTTQEMRSDAPAIAERRVERVLR